MADLSDFLEFLFDVGISIAEGIKGSRRKQQEPINKLNIEQLEEFAWSKAKGKKAKKEILSILTDFGTRKSLTLLRKVVTTEKDPELCTEIAKAIETLQTRIHLDG